jgi:hypothetical protein
MEENLGCGTILCSKFCVIAYFSYQITIYTEADCHCYHVDSLSEHTGSIWGLLSRYFPQILEVKVQETGAEI